MIAGSCVAVAIEVTRVVYTRVFRQGEYCLKCKYEVQAWQSICPECGTKILSPKARKCTIRMGMRFGVVVIAVCWVFVLCSVLALVGPMCLSLMRLYVL